MGDFSKLKSFLFLSSVVVILLVIYHSFVTRVVFSTLPLNEQLGPFASNLSHIGNVVHSLRIEKKDEKYLEKDKEIWKKILFWTSWFKHPWSMRFVHLSSEELRAAGCPSWRCHFTVNKSEIISADAILFSSTMFGVKNAPQYRTTSQRWIWVNVESPLASPAKVANHKLNRENSSHLVNWTMTYHSAADIIAPYGFFLSIGKQMMPIRPNLMSQHPEAMGSYKEALARNATLSEIMGPSWRLFVNRPRLVAWMSGHCGTNSRREDYVSELAKYVPVDKYGRCGKEICQPVENFGCWEENLGFNYLFYLSFENNLCNEYITEKLYLAMVYNLVPIVWGGSDYDYNLPPGSYINARHYHPRDLGPMLLQLQKNRVAYGRYHIWRGFWKPMVRGSMCELCHKLHTDHTNIYYHNIPNWRWKNSNCIHAPKHMFSTEKNWHEWMKITYARTPNTTNYP